MADKDMGLRLKAARERIKKTQKEVLEKKDFEWIIEKNIVIEEKEAEKSFKI